MIKKADFFYTLLFLINFPLHFVSHSFAVPRINEVMSNNESTVADMDGDFSDWVEIYNPDEEDINLEGYFLTDNSNNLTKWTFPKVILKSGEYLIVFASGKEKNFQIEPDEIHADFELSSSGEYIGLISPDGKTVVSEIAPKFEKQNDDESYGLGVWGEAESVVLVQDNSFLSYFVPTDDSLSNSWQTSGDGFDDSSWIRAKQPVGFESISGALERLVETNISEEMKGNNSSAYFRFPFQFDKSKKTAVGAELRVTIDDGFVAYLNGVRIGDFNAPNNISYNARASGSRTDAQVASSPIVIDLSSHLDAIKNGENVLAVHAMNTSAASSDFLLGVRMTARVQDVSVGLSYGFFESPTPGFTNAEIAFRGKVADTKFSPDRGFYDDSFKLEISSKTEGVRIRYTTDGSEPTATRGRLYSGPITISKTTVVRAAAFKVGYEPTNIDTHSYFFVDDIIRQTSSAPAGWPRGSVNGQRYEYGMNQSVVNSSNNQIGGVENTKKSIKSLPAFSVVTDQANLTSSQTGIYSNPQRDGIAWERESSIEMIFPPGYEDPYGNKKGFQSPCGLRIRGGYSRRTQNPKHSFRLFFRSEYGNGRLNYPLFGDEGAESFNKFDFRGPQNYSWAQGDNNRNSFIRDTWSRDLQGEMGQPYKKGRWGHLFLNGIYWGMFQIDERAEASYGESYFGGDREDYDVVKSYGGVTDGDRKSYERLWRKWQQGFRSNTAYYDIQGMNSDGTFNPDKERLVDIENLIDYMIITYYTGDRDGPGSRYTQPRPNNYFGIYNRENPQGFKFFEHDSEHSLGTGENNMVSPFTRSSSLNDFNPHTLHEKLANDNEEYRMLFADRLAMYCYNGGLLTDEVGIQRVNRRADEVGKGIIAHSARWGDTSRSRLAWLNAVQGVRNFISNRVPTVIGQVRSVGWYPDIDPPKLNKHGGFVQSTQQILLTGGPGTIYYTINGEDPRRSGGGITPGAKIFQGTTSSEVLLRRGSVWKYLDNGTNAGTSWRNKNFNDSSWRSGAAELGYGDGGERTTVSYGPSAFSKYVTTYFRRKFNANNVNKFSEIELKLRRDDGAVVYINGKEVARSGMPAGTVGYQTLASNVSGGADETTYYSLSIDPSALVNGENIIAVEVHQAARTSSDMSFDLELSGVQFTTPNPLYLRNIGRNMLQARVKNNSDWSALTKAEFVVDAESASAENLSISEIHYRPALPTSEEIEAGYNDRSDFEFIELFNFSSRPVDLGSLEFSDGIQFDLSLVDTNKTLLPGERCLLVNNLSAFLMRYRDDVDPSLNILGEFKGNLNNDGEQLIVSDKDGNVILDVTYNDGEEWPQSSDGEGYSLIKMNPEKNANDYNSNTWRSSSLIGGNPGKSDSLNFSDWLTENKIPDALIDSDNDGINALTEYAVGTDPNEVSSINGIEVRVDTLEWEGEFQECLILDVTKRIGADDVSIKFQMATKFDEWIDLIFPLRVIKSVNNGDRTETISYVVGPFSSVGKEMYFRKVLKLD